MTYFAAGFDEKEEKAIRRFATGICGYNDPGIAMADGQPSLCI